MCLLPRSWLSNFALSHSPNDVPDPGQQDFQERLDRIAGLFGDIVAHAEVSAQTRCPYRDRHDLCTALFRCRNQEPLQDDPDTLACGHDGTFDYRTAWEAHPRAEQRAQAKILAIRNEAAARRRSSRNGSEA